METKQQIILKIFKILGPKSDERSSCPIQQSFPNSIAKDKGIADKVAELTIKNDQMHFCDIYIISYFHQQITQSLVCLAIKAIIIRT